MKNHEFSLTTIQNQISQFLNSKNFNELHNVYFPHLLANQTHISELDKTKILTFCCHKNSYEGVKTMIEMGANPMADSGFTLLCAAINVNSITIMDYLLKNTSVDLFIDRDPNYQKTYYDSKDQLILEHYLASMAAAYGSIEMIDYLASQGLNFNKNDEHPFCWACSHKNNSLVVEHLIKNYHVDINVFNRIAKETPLSWSICTMNYNTIDLLLSHNVNVDETSLSSITEHRSEELLIKVSKNMTSAHFQFIDNILEEQQQKYNSKPSAFRTLLHYLKLQHELTEKNIQPSSKLKL